MQTMAESAKGGALRLQANEVAALIAQKKFAEADQLAVTLRKAYEATFDPKLKQYSFHTRAEFEEFSKSSDSKFEWIDWGYSQCLQLQAYLASERRDFPAALAFLRSMEAVASMSAGTPAEAGYVLNQMGKPDEGLAAYRRAHALAKAYPSQRVFLAMALRGMGYSLIDLKRLDEAKRVFLESLEIEPGNKVALNELTYIQKKQGAK